MPTKRNIKMPSKAMLLAAGLGTRLRPHTDKIPKVLVKVSGRTLLDHIIIKLCEVGIETVVINLHHKANMIRRHVEHSNYPNLRIIFSDESHHLLDTGGGVKHALEHFGKDPFYVVNGKIIWEDAASNILQQLARSWNNHAMDALLLLVPTNKATGYLGRGDYHMKPDGRLLRNTGPSESTSSISLVYSGIQIIHPRLFESCPKAPFSLNFLWDKAENDGRLFGLCHNGFWMHISTPEALELANNLLPDS